MAVKFKKKHTSSAMKALEYMNIFNMLYKYY